MEECHVFQDQKGRICLFTELHGLLKQKEHLIKAINHLESDINDDSKFAKFVVEACKSQNSKFSSARRSFYKFEELCISFIHYNQNRQTKDHERRSCFKEIREISINAKRDQLERLNLRIDQYKPICPKNPTVNDIAKLKREQRYLLKASSLKEKCFQAFKEAAMARVQAMREGAKRSKDFKKIVLAFQEFERYSVKLNLRIKYLAQKIELLENSKANSRVVPKTAVHNKTAHDTSAKDTTANDTTANDLEQSIDMLIEIDLRNLDYQKHSTDNEQEKAENAGDLYETSSGDYEPMNSNAFNSSNPKTNGDSLNDKKTASDSLNDVKTASDSLNLEKTASDPLNDTEPASDLPDGETKDGETKDGDLLNDMKTNGDSLNDKKSADDLSDGDNSEKSATESSNSKKTADDLFDFEKISDDSLIHEKSADDLLDYELLSKANESTHKEEAPKDGKLGEFCYFCPAGDDLSELDFNPDYLDPTTDGEEFLMFDSSDIQEAAEHVAKLGLAE